MPDITSYFRIPLDMPGQSAALLCGLRKALENLLMRVAIDPQMAACPTVSLELQIVCILLKF